MNKQHTAMQPDYLLLFSALSLLGLGIVMVTSASIALADRQFNDLFFYSKRQLIYAGLGVMAAYLITRIRMVHWEKSGMAFMVFALFLLVLVLLPGVGKTVNGSTRWLDLGPFSFQVSEAARLFLFIYLAGYLVRRGDEVRSRLQGFLKPMLILGVAGMLILAQPDFGSVVVLLLTAMGMMFLAGVRLWQFVIFICGLTVAFTLLVTSSPYRMQRLTAFLDPWSDPFNSGFQLTQSLIAFGSGGWWGTGLGGSVQKLFYLPEAHNDFLLAILAEELGLLGVLGVLSLFGLLVLRAFSIAAAAEKQSNAFGAYLAYGIGLWFALQAIINAGVNMGLLPTKGLTLPLMSAGGSSLLIMCAAIGFLLRIHWETQLASTQALRVVSEVKPRREQLSAAPKRRAA